MKTNEISTEIGILRTSNASEYVTNGELYQVFPEKIKIAQINLPQGIEYSKREKVFYSIGLQYLALNENIKENLLYDYLQSINKAPHVNVPLSTQTITKLVSMIFNRKDKEGELQLIPNKERTIIFNDMYNLTQKEKINIVNKEKGLLKQQRTKQTIYQAIEGWSGSTKITTAGIAESTGLSLRTVKTYWSEFKEYVSDLNKELKSIKKDIMVQEPSIEENVSEIEENDTKIKFDKPYALFDYYELIKFDESLSSISRFNPDLKKLIESFRNRTITLEKLLIEANKLK
jgi:hypothetical protein